MLEKFEKKTKNFRHSTTLKEKQHIYFYFYLGPVNSPHNMRVTQLIVNELCCHGEFAKTTVQSKLRVSP